MNEATTAVEDVRTFRGSSLEALLPQIRGELGPHAVVVRQREGLIGGVGGFFQKKCVEVEARAGGPGVDVYDEDETEGDRDEGDGGRALSQGEGPAGGAVAPSSTPPPVPPARVAASADGLGLGVDGEGPVRRASGSPAREAPVVRNDAATREGLATPAVREMVGQAHPFAEMLEDFGPVEEVQAPPKARALVHGMAEVGLGEDLAREIVEAVLASAMPFAGARRLRTLVRNELALRIPVAPAAAPGPRTIALAGPAGAGKTAALAAVAAAYEAAGVAVVRLDAPDELDAPSATGLTLVDTPSLHGGAAALEGVAKALGSLAGAEVHLVLRAGTAAAAASEAVAGLAALRPSRLLLSGAGETAHLGGVVDAAIRSGLPLGFVAASASEIAPADPRDLAGRIVP